jgi:hypothetical protein
MEKNVHLIALRYRWPPGSWDDMPIARAARLFEVVAEVAERERLALPNFIND